MKKRQRPECVVPRSLGLVLWISRLFGIAPLRIVSKKEGCLIRFSPNLCIYGYFIVTILLLNTVIALGFDLSVPLEKSIRMRSDTRRVVWIADVAVVVILTCAGAYLAPAQMKRLIDYVIRVQKINSELKVANDPKPSDNDHYRNVVVALTLTFAIMVADFATIMIVTVEKNRRVWVAVMYSCYYFCYTFIQFLEMQFIFTVTQVLSSLRLINFRLKNLRMGQDNSVFKPTSGNRIQPYTMSIQIRSVNKMVDTLAAGSSSIKDQTNPGQWRTETQTIRHLSISYNSVCGIIREIDRNYGVVVLLLLASFLLHLIVTLYYMITDIIYDSTAKRSWKSVSHPLLQLVWCALHTMDLVMIIEPCHRTHAEIETTKGLIGHLMCTTSTDYDPLSNELELFSRNLLFNQVSYSPLQVCTLTRSLIVTVLSSITTYLVVMIQL